MKSTMFTINICDGEWVPLAGIRGNPRLEIRSWDEHDVNFCNSLWENKEHTRNFYPGSDLPEDNSPMSCLSIYFVVVCESDNTWAELVYQLCGRLVGERKSSPSLPRVSSFIVQEGSPHRAPYRKYVRCPLEATCTSCMGLHAWVSSFNACRCMHHPPHALECLRNLLSPWSPCDKWVR